MYKRRAQYSRNQIKWRHRYYLFDKQNIRIYRRNVSSASNIEFASIKHHIVYSVLIKQAAVISKHSLEFTMIQELYRKEIISMKKLGKMCFVSI